MFTDNLFTDKEKFKGVFRDRFQLMYGKPFQEGTSLEFYQCLTSILREQISRKWHQTNKYYLEKKVKQIYYFSMEFLLGRLLKSNLLNLGVLDFVETALGEMGLNLEKLAEEERDPGLGSGGLGRLAADLLDSMASLNISGHGCGMRYRYGLFEQKIVGGEQEEFPDDWLKNGYAWEFRKPDKAVEVRFGGNVRVDYLQGKPIFTLENYTPVRAVPYDIPMVGYHNGMVNTLRLWSAEAVDREFDYPSFFRGEYLKSVENKYAEESISQILYPDDSFYEGLRLRLRQQYFFVSAGVQSIIRRYKKMHCPMADLANHVAIHINDTHPSLVIPELMRILIDEEGLGWDEAWEITVNTVSYTNHTTLPEALEKWPLDLVKELLPRIYLIVNEINERFCRELWQRTGDLERVARMAVIADGQVKMGPLSVAGSYSVNGVAKLHTEILKREVMRDFYDLYPYKFNNKTNGITHRRWLLLVNPPLTHLITDTIGSSWIRHPTDLINLLSYVDDPGLQEGFIQVKRENKERLAKLIKNKTGLEVDVDSIFDVQIKRMHAYKRQLLNVFHIMHLYNLVVENPQIDIFPRTFIFAGKAAPGYFLVKRIIKLINTVAEMVNRDPRVKGKIKVVFLENYNVSLAERIFPAADVSEQISSASKEASGTGNMKFMMNGAVTIGTLDGANVEIREEVGAENFVEFGLTAEEVINYSHRGNYSAWEIYNRDPRVSKIMEQFVTGLLPGTRNEFSTIYDYLLHHNDEYFVLADFSSYVEAQKRIERAYQDRKKWSKMCLTNIAHSGAFTSDRAINEYAVDIWKVRPVLVSPPDRNDLQERGSKRDLVNC